MNSLPKTIRTIARARMPMPEQSPEQRVQNFFEVALGYGMDAAIREADRCLDCTDPKCLQGCPVSVDIPGFIRKLTRNDYRGAYDLLARTNVLPAICGRVCPQEEQCEGMCTVGDTLEPIAIGRLERWLGDKAIELGWSSVELAEKNGFKVGIVGSGPAGIACAADLARLGCDVTIFEALHTPGGVLRYGIPEFRLPKRVLDAEIEKLERLSVRIQCNTLVGRLFTPEQMLEEQGFHALFIATGAGLPKFMGIPGEGLNGVLSANELLTRCNLMQAGQFPQYDTPLGLGRRVAVIGSGNTAMDALRVSKRLGAEAVLCVYRRSRNECPARAEELHHAEQEGVEFHWLTNPVEILDDGQGNVRGLRCQRMQLGEPDASGRRRPEAVPGSEHDLDVDMVVYAIGTNANPIIGQTSNIARNRWGYLQADDSLATSMAGVWAGGDIVTGSATVILAMGAGRRAARNIARYLGIAEPERNPSADCRKGVFGLEPDRVNYVRMRALALPERRDARGKLMAAALRPLLPIERLRHPFPLALFQPNEADAGEPVVQSLRDVFDHAVDALRVSAEDPEALERLALGLEARVRRLAAEAAPTAVLELGALAEQAAGLLLTEAAANGCASLRHALPRASLVGCSQAGAERLVEHVCQGINAAHSRALRDELGALEASLAVVDQCDFMTTAAAYSADYLGAALGPQSASDFDLRSLSQLLTPLRSESEGEPPRRARIRQLQQALAASQVLQLPASAWVFRSCTEAAAALETRLNELDALLRAAEQAHLETRAAVLDRASTLAAGARALLPKSLLLIDADRLDPAEREQLLALLATDLPVKVLCTSAVLVPAGLPGILLGHALLPGGPAATLAAHCRGLRGVSIVQAALSELPGCSSELQQALAAAGPALIAVYTGERDPSLPAYVAAAAACAARVFPTYVRMAGETRLALDRNPEPDAAWPSVTFWAQDAALQRIRVDEAFTAAQLAASWPQLSAGLRVVGSAGFSDAQLPAAQALALVASSGAAVDAFVSVVDEQDHLLRALVPPLLLEYAQHVAEHWRALQEAAAEEGRAQEPSPLAALQPVPPPLAAIATQSGAAPTSAGAAADAAEPSTPANAETYVETARCSSCDECVKRAPGLFVYNADKRAVLRSPRSGSFRELVEAAEHCKMAIIHPGQPWDDTEPDLDVLRQRAAALA